jgi:Tfp pilus assembly protein PilF
MIDRFRYAFALMTGACLLLGGCPRQERSGSATSSPAATSTSPATTLPTAPSRNGAAVDQKLNSELSAIMPLIRARQTGAARVRIRNYLNIHPDDAQACFLFGLTYHREKKYGEARPWFEQAIAIAPEFAVTHHFYGWTLYWLGELAASRREFEIYLQTNPNEHDSQFAIGLICLDEDDLDCAERQFKQSLASLAEAPRKDDAAESRARARLGEVYERRGDFAQARSELEQAVTLYPDHYEALYKLYRVLLRLNEPEKAAAVHAQYIETRERIRPGSSFPE